MKMELTSPMKRDASRERERDRSRRGERPSRFSDATSRDRSRDRDEHKRSSCKRLYVSNIPYDYRWQELKDLFRDKVGEVSYVELFYDEHEKSRGCGVVEFATESLGEKAMEIMQRYEVNGRALKLKEDNIRNERDKHGYVVKSGNRSGDRRSDQRDEQRRSNMNYNEHHNANEHGSGNVPNYNTYGLSLSFLENLGITEPLQSRVFVANLDYKVDAKKLREVFKLAGKVQNVDLSVDKDGNSRGFAVIEYDHPVESVQAISMLDHQMLFDRRMTVRMDRALEKLDHSRLPEGLKGVGQGLGPNGEPLRDVAHNLPNVNTVAPQVNPTPPQQSTSNMLNASIPQGFNLAALSNVVGGNLANLGTIQSLAGSLSALSNPLLTLGGSDLGSLGIGASLANASSLSGLNNTGLNVANNMSSSNLAAISNIATNTSQNSQLGSFNRENILNQNQSYDLAGSNTSNSSAGYLTGNFSNRDSHGFSANQTGNDSYRSSDLFSALSNNTSNRLTPSVNILNAQGDGLIRGTNSLHGQAPSDTLLVSNLPSNCTWQDLRDKFREMGGIKSVEMRTKDTGLIRFANDVQAQRAHKLMDGSRFAGRSMHVSYI